MSGNKIDENLLNLKGLEPLKHLYLDRCGISTLFDGLFQGLNRLETLVLHHNPVVRLESLVFRDLISLTFLDLSNLSELSIFDEGCFDSLLKLVYLNLSQNTAVNKLKSNALKQLKSLTCLVMANCDIRSIDKDWFSSLESLEKLELGGRNVIGKLEPNLFGGLAKVKKIVLARDQATFNCKGKRVSRTEFEQLVRLVTRMNDTEIIYE